MENLADEKVASQTGGEAMAASLRKTGSAAAKTSQAPEAFVYDPAAGKSLPNKGALSLQDDGKNCAYLEAATPAALKLESFTLELVFKPQAELNTKGGDWLNLLSKSRQDDKSAAVSIGIERSKPPHSYNWLQGVIMLPGGKTVSLQGNRYNGITHMMDKTPWRHVALTYDSATRVASFYVGYRLMAQAKLDAPLALDNGSIFIGGSPGGRGLSGDIDEARISNAALDPHDFLRLSAVELANVSFRSPPSAKVPADAGCIDVRLCYGAVGDGKVDDTAALRKAMEENDDRVPIEHNTLYLPPGVYKVSDTCRWTRFMMLRGEGPDKTIIRLADASPGFDNPLKHKSVIAASRVAEETGGKSGDSIDNNIQDLTIETGKGNPGAIALTFHSNNKGSARNLVLCSGDGAGVAGLGFLRGWPGPSLIKDVRIEGFDYAAKIGYREYSLVFENIDISGQRIGGICNQGNSVSIRKLVSRNKAPAVLNGADGKTADKGDPGSLVVILDSQLSGGDADRFGIDNRGALYARNIKTDGYKGVLVTHRMNADKTWKADPLNEPQVQEYVAGKVHAAFDAKPSSLNLPVEETPLPPADDIKNWINVQSFRDKAAGDDWTAAVQAAIDAGGTTVYFPANQRYPVKGTVYVRGKTQRLIGYRTGLSGNPKDGSKPMLAITGTEKTPVFLERFSVDSVQHTAARPLVMISSEMHDYQTAQGVGPLFMEDVGVAKLTFTNGQKIWARQWNPEARQPAVEITNKGAQMWILGLKTEYESINIVNSDGAKTEVLGGLIYPVGNVPAGMPMFENTDSAFSVVIAESCYSKNHEVFVKDTQIGQTRNFTAKDANWAGGRAKIDLYVSGH
jgi:hypothetical protein